MQEKTNLLRISYWIGAILDAFTIIPMLSPKMGGAMFGIDHFNPGVEYRYAMIIASSLMLGWTFLLLWANRKPIERSGIFIITVFPVMIGLVLSGLYAVQAHVVKIENMIPMWIVQVIVTTLFTISYLKAQKLLRNKPSSHEKR